MLMGNSRANQNRSNPHENQEERINEQNLSNITMGICKNIEEHIKSIIRKDCYVYQILI